MTSVDQTSEKVTIHYDQVDAEGNKIVEAQFEADGCIGADGVKSVIRGYVVPDLKTPFRYSGTYAYRSLIPMDRVVEANGIHVGTIAHVHVGHKKVRPSL